MSSPQQILGDGYQQTFERLGLNDKDWKRQVRTIAKNMPEIEDDDAIDAYEQENMKVWIDSLEAKFEAAKTAVDSKVEVATEVAVDSTVEVATEVAVDSTVEVATEVAVDSKVEVATEVAVDSTDNAVSTPKPKRAITAWTAFFTFNRAQFKEKNPDIASKAIMGALSKVWKSLNDEGKAQFIKMAEDDKIRYNKEMETYVPNGSAKAKKVKTHKCSKQCKARMGRWSKNGKDGLKQCKRMCASDESNFCPSCQNSANKYDGRAGPTLWKYCYDNGIPRSDTKGKSAGLWYGTMDQMEEGHDSYPASSFTTDDHKRVVVMSYPDNDNHGEVASWHQSVGAVLAHDTVLKETWPLGWHSIGINQKKKKSSRSSKKKVKMSVVEDVEEMFAKEEVEDVEDEDEIIVIEDDVVVVRFDDLPWNVNYTTKEVIQEGVPTGGFWIMDDDAPDMPDGLEEKQKWLGNFGRPDKKADAAVAAACDSDDDSGDDSDAE